MAPKRRPALELAEELQKEAQQIRDYLRRIDALHQRGELRVRDVDEAYSGALLGWHTSLERHLEQLFLGLLLQRLHVKGANVRPRFSTRSDRVALDVLSGAGSYVDWLPLHKTEKLAKAAFEGKRPFDRITSDHRAATQRLQVVRNAIAHRSTHALRSFKGLVDHKGMPPAQKRPAGYLRGTHSGSQTQIEHLMTEGSAMVRTLCQPD
jgi:hypothetical protein